MLSLSRSSCSRVRMRVCRALTRAALLEGGSSAGSISDSEEPCVQHGQHELQSLPMHACTAPAPITTAQKTCSDSVTR